MWDHAGVADGEGSVGRLGGGRRLLHLALGVACVVLGAVLVVRPFTSLAVLVALVALAAIATGAVQWSVSRGHGGGVGIVLAGGWVLLGVLVILWPDRTVDVVAVLVGIGMVAAGVAEAFEGVVGNVPGSPEETATGDRRAASILRGLAGTVLGVLALAWPDITLLVVAVAFGVRTLLYGLSELLVSVRGRRRDPEDEPERPVGTWRRAVRTGAAALGLVAALLLAALSWTINRSEAIAGPFYDTPDEVPAEPGRLLRGERYDDAPAGTVGWRILYTTTRADGVPAVASGLVVVPEGAGDDPLPVIAWAHGTTGVAQGCAPSVLSAGLESGAMFVATDVAEKGWALVATDYVGLGADPPHPYLVGEPAGRSVLDAVRAARHLDAVRLEDRTVVWGHSQGGGAALWTGQIAPEYAPDAEVLAVAALAPAADLPGLVDTLEHTTGGSLFASYVAVGYDAAYEDIRLDDYVRPQARQAVRRMARGCLSTPDVLPSIATSLAVGMSGFEDLSAGSLLRRLDENVPRGPYEVPLLVAQGEADTLITPEVQAGFVDRLCADGIDVDHRTYPGRDHVGLVEADSPLIADLVAWTEARFAGEPAATSCAP